MAGGAPAGINIPTPDLGWRTKSTKINTTTIHGKSKTTPRGIDMLELPFNLRGRRKKANLEFVFDLVLTSSIVGRGGDVGSLFITLCTKPMVAIFLSSNSWEDSRLGGLLSAPVGRRGRQSGCNYNMVFWSAVSNRIDERTMIKPKATLCAGLTVLVTSGWRRYPRERKMLRCDDASD